MYPNTPLVTRSCLAPIALAVAGTVGTIGASAARAGSYSNDFNTDADGGTLTGVATLDAGSLRLTPATNSVIGSFFLPDLDPGLAVKEFTATFELSTAAGTTGGRAEGLSFFLGPVAGTETFGEDGPPAGLAVSFDLFDNDGLPGGGGPDNGPGISFYANGVQASTTNRDPFTNGTFVPIRVTLSQVILSNGQPFNQLEVTYDGNPLFSSAPGIDYFPAPGDRFGFGGRTGGGVNATQRIDNLVVTTTTVPEPTTASLLTAALLALLGRRRQRRPD